MKNEIKVLEIMKEIEAKAKNRRMAEDLKMLNDLDIKKLKGCTIQDDKVVDSADYLISSKLKLRKIQKSGIFSRLINYMLRKFYYALRYLLDGLIVSQEKFNSRVNTYILENEKSPLDFDYSKFQKKFRGDSEIIKANFQKYIRFFEGRNNVLDIACGNGEFLELLKDNGINGTAVDINTEMILDLQKRNFPAYDEDAVKFLQNRLELKENLFDGVFCSQFAEHLDNEYLISLIKAVYENLKEDSFFVMETLNVKSLSVFTNSLYKDPTHIRPIHPDLLSFLFESAGFKNVSLIFSSDFSKDEKLNQISEISENDKIYNENVRKLNELLFAPQDYAVVGKK